MTSVQPVSHRERGLLTVNLEDYFQVAPFGGIIQHGQWYRFETRVEQNTHKVLDLLDAYGAKATFFCVGWIADQLPEVIAEVARRGHEVASKGYYHRALRQMDTGEFREDARRAREALERAAGRRVLGYRVARGWLTRPEQLWALDVLAEEGFAYDSSILPRGLAFARARWRCEAHVHRHGEHRIHELPLPSLALGGLRVPIGGGNYLRQSPPALMRRAVARWQRHSHAPFLLFFHVWELDPEQPRITGAPWVQRIRQYRNLECMERHIRAYLERMRFSTIAEHLDLELSATLAEPVVARAAAPAAHRAMAIAAGGPSTAHRALATVPAGGETGSDIGTALQTGSGGGGPMPVTVIVPCFNEEGSLRYLARTLTRVQAALADRYALHFLFVNDGSSDRTQEILETLFGERDDCALHRHQRNRGVAAAIMTGIREARSDVVCSIDSDCTYDPHQLAEMIPLLGEDVDLVTASPYHRRGRVENVPGWRLALSRGLSVLYRRVLHHKLATYTACFRVYRRAAVADLELHDGGFLGVAELLGLVDLRGGRIVECPAVLESRLLGHSKMKVARTIAGHLGLLGRLWLARWRRRPARSLATAGAPTSAPWRL